MGYIKFLGTAGARFVMIKQLRASGGMWFSVCGTNFLVDPGPGSLVRITKSRPKLDPSKLDFIFLSHKHLDHSCDINLMIEAMTNGGFNRRGIVLAPEDALVEDPVIFKYILKYLENVEIIDTGNTYKINGVHIEILIKLRHSSETYGFKMKCEGLPTVAYLPDTGYFDEIIPSYEGSDVIIINTVMYEKRNGLNHLSLPEAEDIIKKIKPKKAILTHFGMQMLQNKIWLKGEEISNRVGTQVIIANDGMKVELNN